MKKIQSNIDRDKRVNEELKNDGWTIVRIWEHEIRKQPAAVVKTIQVQVSEKKDQI